MSTETLDRPAGIATLYRRAASGALLSALGRGNKATELSRRQLELKAVELDRHHLAEYNRVCGFTLRDQLPATYLHNVAFPLAMDLMTRADFPFPVIGMVHVENRIEQLRPVLSSESPTVRVWAEGLRPHRAGKQLDLVGEAEIAGEVVWREVSTYLRPGRPSGSERRAPAGSKGRPPAPQPEAVWSLPGDLGRQFAAVSGDRNPIHMSAISAKLFGMPAAIAHGMWLKARCLAQLESELPDSFTVEVAFQRPVVLPTRVGFASASIDGRRTFTLHDVRKGTPHLRGSIAAG